MRSTWTSKRQQKQNVKVVALPAEHGDCLDVPRTASDDLDFASPEAREQFAPEAAGLGFNGVDEFERDEADELDEPNRFGISLERVDAVSLDAITPSPWNCAAWQTSSAANTTPGKIPGSNESNERLGMFAS